MLDRPTDKEYQAFARIVRTDDGKLLFGYLERARENAKRLLVSADADSIIRRLQGRAETLQFLAEALDPDPDLIRKLDDRARRR